MVPPLERAQDDCPLSAANVPEVLQSLLRRVQSLEEELKEYKKK